MGVRRVSKSPRKAELGMSNTSKKIWVAITAYNPMNRINHLVNVLNEYMKYPYDFGVRVYIDYESQHDIELLDVTLEPFKKLNIDLVVAPPEYEHWYLTWAHKTDLARAALNNEADFYIYQEDDTLITLENFHYWRKWHPRLSLHGLEPGFIRYENHKGLKVPFDNHHVFSLTKPTPNVWSEQSFQVPIIPVVDREVELFVQVSSPYYAGMILTSQDAKRYIRTKSFDPQKSYHQLCQHRVVEAPLNEKCYDYATDPIVKEHIRHSLDAGVTQVLYPIRNWPIADRSSMGLAFEDIPYGYEHRRCIPIYKEEGKYKPHKMGLICHDDEKYAPELEKRNVDVLDCSNMFTLD